MNQTFEEYLLEVAPSGVHTNNSPEGFERWESELDVQELEDYAQEYGNKMYAEAFMAGQKAGMDTANQIMSSLMK